MFERLNRDRVERGLAPLKLDPRLSEVARHHSADMRDHRFFEHVSPRTGSVDNRLDAAGYLFLTARENISEAPDVARSQDALLDSPPHYENITATDITHVGIGIVPGGVVDPQNLMVTQVFATPLTEEAPARAESSIVERIREQRAAAGLAAARSDPKLTELARAHVAQLDEAGSGESVARAGEAIAQALDGREAARLSISAQVVPGSAQLQLPDAVRRAPSCAFGLGVRRVRADKGRPALQVLLLVLESK